MKTKITIIILLVLILGTLLIGVIIDLSNEIEHLYENLETQLIINEQQNAFNQVVIENVVTKGMLQGALDNFYNYLMEQLIR